MSLGLTILVAEDHPVIRRMMSITLTTRGHTVELVGNGNQAVEAVRSGTFDLVLMDLRMPEMDGLEAARAIRLLDCDQPPIYALSGDHDVETVESCLEAGMNGHLKKPIVTEDLLAVIAGLMTE